MNKPPLTPLELKQLELDSKNIRATALRKQVTLEDFEEKRELSAIKANFTLGCWLFYYSRRVYLEGAEGLKSRIDCARRIFLSGINNPGYDFFTVFDFGERQFDSIFEMGDAEQVIEAIRLLIPGDKSGNIAKAFANFGWPLSATLRSSRSNS